MATTGALDDSGSAYARAVVGAVAAVALDDLVGIYLYGSGATGRFVPGRSDLDLGVVTRGWLDPGRTRELVGAARAVRRPRSVRGLDLWVAPSSEPAAPSADPHFSAWVLTSIDSELLSGPDHPGDARLAVLFAMCRQHAIALAGPDPRDVFAEVDPAWVIGAMRVDLQMTGPAGWYRVLNACRTMHYLDTGQLCERSTGAQWARGRVGDVALLDDAVTWRETGSGPAMDPQRVAAFVAPVLTRLAARAGSAQLRGVPVAESRPRVTIVDDHPLVSCILRAPAHPELLALAARRFGEQQWPERELIVLDFGSAATRDALPDDPRIRVVAVPADEADEWAGFALQEARGPIVASWDAATWYAPDRLTQQVSELLSSNAVRVVAPWVSHFDTQTRKVRVIHDLSTLEEATLLARRHAWEQFGTSMRRGKRGDVAVTFGPLEGREDYESGSFGDVAALVGSELDGYVVAVVTATAAAQWQPAVSCLMPTYNRRAFAGRAIRDFLAQDYPNLELVIIDDGEDRIEDLVPAEAPSVRYVRVAERATIGRKRQLACEAADGDVMVQWDDDDWYGPTRVSRQIAPLAAGTADISGIVKGYMLDLPTFRFYKGGPPLHEGNLHASIIAGTLAFTRSAWRSTGGYLDSSMGEDVAMLRAVTERGGRLAPIVNDGMYITVRHGGNSWRLVYDAERGPAGWNAVAPPEFLSADDLAFYRGLPG